MRVKIHFYSISRDLAGKSEMHLNVAENATLADAISLLYERMPALEPVRSSVLYALGLDYAEAGAKLFEDCEISIIPPVQGG